MAAMKTLSVLALSALASAHGHVESIIVDGAEFPGAIPSGADEANIGWAAENQDNGFVEPSSFGSEDIICHKGATASANAAPVAAGGSVTLNWNTWPESHKGPVIDYIAKCDPDCASADKASLAFAKIAEAGVVDGAEAPGTWATDDLMADGNSWTVTIPESLAPGNYVLRHEIIALHSAGQAGGAQSYPQCINLEVTGSGSASPEGVPATEFYTEDDPGILFDLYTAPIEYTIPGPALWTA